MWFLIYTYLDYLRFSRIVILVIITLQCAICLLMGYSSFLDATIFFEPRKITKIWSSQSWNASPITSSVTSEWRLFAIGSFCNQATSNVWVLLYSCTSTLYSRTWIDMLLLRQHHLTYAFKSGIELLHDRQLVCRRNLRWKLQILAIQIEQIITTVNAANRHNISDITSFKNR